MSEFMFLNGVYPERLDPLNSAPETKNADRLQSTSEDISLAATTSHT
jgi:hypothetical protein